MKKFGFTLAEVLITLGIIGVVAALTAPALVTSSRNQANAARLSVIVSNLENAIQTMMIQENADTIYATAFGEADNKTAMAGHLGRYLNIHGLAADSVTLANFYSNTGGPFLLDSNGGRGAATNFNGLLDNEDPAIILLKQGGTLFITRSGGQASDENEAARLAAAEDGRSLLSRAFNIVIDINGATAPNIAGRDIFPFILGGNGRLYPCGGDDAAEFYGGASLTACPPTGEYGWSCAARVVADGYQMNY